MPLTLFTILHPLVDACSVTVLMVGGFTWERAIIYNVIAFAFQFPIGVLLDARPQWVRSGFGLSIVLTLAGAAYCAFGIGGWIPLVSACLGNALFHLSAGKHILDAHGGHGGPIGLFISTGALGLVAGLKLAGAHGLACCIGFGSALAVFAACAWLRIAFKTVPPMMISVRGLAGYAILVGLFCLVAWRCWAGLLVSRMSGSSGFILAAVGAAVTLAGKAVGGYAGDRFGRWKTTVVSVAGSLSLCFFCKPEQIAAWFILLFVAQLATGPVLSLLYEKSGQAGGTAFGINCFGLFAGSV